MVKSARILILLSLLGTCANVFAQQLSRQVLVPVAGVMSIGAINYSQTIGETAIDIITSSDFVMTQGFQQPGIKILLENPQAGNSIKVYPNPVTDFVTVELSGDVSRSFRIEIINISGIVVKTEKIVFTESFWDIRQLPVDQLLKGLYFVRILSDDGVISRTFKINKM
jgi:hypothetical protein